MPTRPFEVNGSPIFQFLNPAINPNGTWVLDFFKQYPNTRDFLPWDFIEIDNLSGSPINVNINQFQSVFIANSVIKTIEDIPIWDLSVQNLDSANTISAGQIKIITQLKPMDSNKLALKVGQKLRGIL